MSIDTELYKYISTNITTTSKIYLGKINRDDATLEDTVICISRLPSFSSNLTPSYLDIFNIQVFAKYYDTAIDTANKIIELFQLQTFTQGSYRCWVSNIQNLGMLIDEEDIVQVPLQLELKHTGL